MLLASRKHRDKVLTGLQRIHMRTMAMLQKGVQSDREVKEKKIVELGGGLLT